MLIDEHGALDMYRSSGTGMAGVAGSLLYLGMSMLH
jgi:hypothetical protein